MCIDVTRIMGEAVLPAHLAEFAGPVGEHCGSALVGKVGKLAAIGMVVAAAQKPAPPYLVISRCIKTESALLERQLLALAPDELAPPDKGMVDGAAQRLPSQRGINPIKLRKKIAAQVVVPAPIRKSNIHVGRLGDVFIGTQMRYRAHIAFCGGSEQRVLCVAGIAAEELPGCFQENAFRRRNDMFD